MSVAVLLLVPAVTVPSAAAAPEGRVLQGMALSDVENLDKLGAHPDLGMFWVGPWTKDNWGSVDRALQASRTKGVTPVVQWYYWGDDISPDCVENGCWSSLHRSMKTRDDWNSMAVTLAKKIHANHGNAPVYVILETEFNKGGIQTYEPFDGYLAAQAGIFRKHAPNAKVVLGFGSWGYNNYDRFDRAIAGSHYLGYQDLKGSTRDSDEVMMKSVDQLVETSRYLKDRFGKPTFLTHWGISTYGGSKYEWMQEQLVRQFFERIGEFRDAGTVGAVYRSLKDNPNFDTKNYYGVAERYWGLRYADGSHKRSLDDWVRGVKALQGSNVRNVPGTVEAESLPATVGSDVYDASASGNRAWLLWSNGHVSASVASSASGTHPVTIHARGSPAAGEWPVMVATLDGTEVGRWTVPSRSYQSFTADVALSAGDARELRVAFVNDRSTSSEDRNLWVDRVVVQAPSGASGESSPKSEPAPSSPPASSPSDGILEAEHMTLKTTGGRFSDSRASGGAAWNLWSNGKVETRFNAPTSGTYAFDVKAKGTEAAGVSPLMGVRVNGKDVQQFYVNARDAYWGYGASVWLPAGEHTLSVDFLNDRATATEDRNLHVDAVHVKVPPSGGATSGTLEAESAAVKTTGGRFSDSRASGGAAWNLWSNGYVQDTIHTTRDGTVTFSVKAKGTEAAGVSPLMALVVDGREHHYYVNARDAYWDYRASVVLPAGEHTVQVKFLNDRATATEDRNLHVDAVQWDLS